MKKDAKNDIKQSFNESIKALGVVVKSLYALAPFAVVVGAVLITAITWITLQWSPFMIGTASLMVVIVSLCIFAARENFGEAILSLVGGLLTIFAFEWTPARYIAFMTVWFGFAFSILLISCVKLHSKIEEIYRMAALRLVTDGEDYVPIEKQLRRISSSKCLKMLGPIEKAEIIRIFAFRNLPINLFAPCLKAVEMLTVITKVDIKTIALFFSDFFLTFDCDSNADTRDLVDELYDVIKVVPVPPEDFFLAFEKSRRLLVSQTIPLIIFLDGLKECLTSGVSPNDMYDEMRKMFIDHVI